MIRTSAYPYYDCDELATADALQKAVKDKYSSDIRNEFPAAEISLDIEVQQAGGINQPAVISIIPESDSVSRRVAELVQEGYQEVKRNASDWVVYRRWAF